MWGPGTKQFELHDPLRTQKPVSMQSADAKRIMECICGLPVACLPGQAALQQAQVLVGDAEDSMRELPFDVNKLVELCRQNDVQQVGVFGSSARGEADEHSDIDLLISFSKRISLLQMVALERQFSHALGRKSIC